MADNGLLNISLGDPRKLVQYKVVLTSGEDRGIGNYIWAKHSEIKLAELRVAFSSPNYSGFNALPGGFHYYEYQTTNDVYDRMGTQAFFWTSSRGGGTPNYVGAWYRSLYYGNDSVIRGAPEPTYDFALSVRCVKNPDY